MKAIYCVLLVAILAVGCRPFNSQTFDAAAWASGDFQDRTSMADDLIANHIKAGMLSGAIQEMLGEPDQILDGNSDSGGNPLPGSCTYSYTLGNWSMGGMDDAFLYVHFDEKDEVLNAEVQGY